MAKYKLKELCEFITDGTHQTPEYCGNDGVIFLSSKDVTERKINWDNVKYIPNALHEKLCKRLKPRKNDILLAKNGTTGVAAIVDRDEIFDVYVSLAVLRPLDVVYPKYLLYAINSPVVKRQFDAGLKGVGVPNLHLGVIKETWINVVKKEEQQKVCKVLDKIEKIIELKKQELQLVDDLIKARFVEMFGDPVLNDKKFSTLSGEDFFKLSNGKAVPEEKRHEVGIPAYGGNGISWYTNEVLRVEDTLVVGRVGFQSGNVHYAVGPLWITDNAMYISQYDKGKINLVFLCELMQRVNFSRFQDAGDLKKITQKPFMSFQYILPSMELQQKFVDFKEQVNKSKVAVQKSLDETQLLFDSLMQKYFG